MADKCATEGNRKSSAETAESRFMLNVTGAGAVFLMHRLLLQPVCSRSIGRFRAKPQASPNTWGAEVRLVRTWKKTENGLPMGNGEPMKPMGNPSTETQVFDWIPFGIRSTHGALIKSSEFRPDLITHGKGNRRTPFTKF